MKPLAQPIKIIFFDIDDTLYHKNDAYIPDSITQIVIPELKARGIIPAIATGRCLGAFPDAVRVLVAEQGIDLLVTINGQYNCYQGDVVSAYPLTMAEVERVIGKLQALDIDYAFVGESQIAVSNDSEAVKESLIPITADYIVDADFYKNHRIFQLLAFYPPEKAPAVTDAGVFAGKFKEIRWHPQAVDILNQANSKAQGIQDVLKTLDIDMQHAMAFGDGLNDIEMLATVGYGVAMGNAVDALKARADFVTQPILDDGVLHALKKLAII